MIKKMEIRFTVVAILVISIVLLGVLVTINAISIGENLRRVDNSLNRMAMDMKYESKLLFENNNPAQSNKLNINDVKDEKHFLNKEENRSFEVFIDKDLNLIGANLKNQNIIDDTSAYEFGLQALEDNKEYGFVSEYRYFSIERADFTRIIFLDYSFERNTELNFIWASLIVYILAIILVAVLVRIFLKPVMRPIREAYAKQKQFITDASHELKTPLTVISTDIQLIEMEKGNSPWTKSINNQIEKLKALINNLVTLSRMEEESTQLNISEINLSDIVNDVVMGFEPAIKASNKTFNYNIEENIKIKGDYDSLEQVMSILMDNALKYTNNNGTISVNLLKKGRKVILIVSNSTDTIEKGKHNEYFERFYRADKSRNSQTGGFGIGLSVVKSTIEKLNGKIEAKSPDGKKLVISIILE